MAEPIVDSRRNQELKNQLLRRLREYLPDYRLAEGKNDAGLALLYAVAGLAEGTIDRLNRVPEKNYLEFLNTIGIKVPPALAARVPLTFIPQKDASDPVVINAGTKVTAKSQDDENLIFETQKSFSLNPAKLVKAYYASQPDDHIYDITAACEGREGFDFKKDPKGNLQDHCLFIGHDNLLKIGRAHV